MPGKKKGGKKGKKKKEEALPDGMAEHEAERKALIEEAKSLQRLKEREEVQFNEFQQQKEKLNYFWIVSKKLLEDKRSELRNKERELQDLEERHQVEVKVYKQRVKHLLFEHQNETTHAKTEAQVALKLAQDDHRESEAQLKKDRRGLKLELKELELSHEDYLKSLKQEQDQAITMLRLEFERKAKELQSRYDTKMRTVRSELEAQRKADIQRIEDRKGAHIASLMQAHEKAFAEIKNYYSDITHSNLDLIKSLKEEVADMKKQEASDEKLMFEIAQENKRIGEPLKRAMADVKRLQKARDEYRADVETLKKVKAKLLVGGERLRALQWEHEVLQQRTARAEKERDRLYEQFQRAVYDVQQKTGFKNLLLERKLAAATDSLEKKEAQLSEVLTSANLEPSVLGAVSKRLEEVVNAKDASIRELQSELNRVTVAHNRLLSGMESKLAEFGVPSEELGFRPIREGDDFSTTARGGTMGMEPPEPPEGAAGGAGGGEAPAVAAR